MKIKLSKYKFKSKIIILYILIYVFSSIILNFIFNNTFLGKTDVISDINMIEKYYQLCNNQTLINNKNFTEILNPKISIISPIFNKENYIIE